MSLLPNFRAELDAKLTAAECATAITKIRGVKGVISVNFNEKSRDARITCGNPKADIAAEVAKVEGVKKVHLRGSF